MKVKKQLAIPLAGVCFILAAIFFVVPGPSIIFMLIATVLLAPHYPWAMRLLRKTQKAFTKACHYLDEKIAKRKGA